MRRSGRLKPAVLVAASTVVMMAVPARADFHTQGVAAGGAGGKAVVSPGLKDRGNRHYMHLDFTVEGPAFASLQISTNVTWDCHHDPGEDEDVAVRHGFDLTSLRPDETRMSGAGTAVGRCTGWAPEYPFPYELSCPVLALAYTRVAMVINLVGTCMYTWGPQMGGGDFNLVVRLANPSADFTIFDIESAAFRFRG